jgi:chromosome segregation ATPase
MNTASEADTENGEGTQGLLLRLQSFEIENEQLSKTIREREHSFHQKIKELTLENETIKRSYSNIENLLTTYKRQSTTEIEKITSLDNQISELENKLFLCQQNEMNLKRQNQNLTLDISNLNLDIEKLRIINKSDNSAILTRHDQQETLEGVDEETKKLLLEMMNEIDELKKENNQIAENALNMLTEKELSIMELREQIDEGKSVNKNEIARLVGVINDLNSQLNEPRYDDEDDKSESSEEESHNELKYSYDRLKTQFDEKLKEWQYEKAQLLKEFQLSEEFYKSAITDQEIELSKLKAEITISEVNRYNLEKELYNKNDHYEIDFLRIQIKQLEDVKEKSDIKYKEHYSKCQAELKELELSNKEYKDLRAENEKEINNLKNQIHKLDIETREKHKIELGIKEKEILQLKDRREQLEKEKDSLKLDLNLMKKNYEKNRDEYRELSENLKKIKENSENEMHKWEEKYYILEKKFENEKSQLIEQNKELVLKLGGNRASSKSISTTYLNTLSNVLENEDDEKELDSGKIFLLENEVSMLNQKLHEVNAKLLSYNKNATELDILRKENTKFKSDLKEMKDMYEKQIEEIQQKAMQTNSELHNTRKRTITNRETGKFGLSPQQIQILAELQTTMNKLTAENKYLSETIQIVNKQVESIKTLRDNDIKFLKEEIRATEEQAVRAKVDLAHQAFEKDSEIIRLRKSAKRYKQKYVDLVTEIQTKTKK